MNYSLSYSLGKRLGIQDPTAADYIAAVRTAGATVTSAQASKINTFYKSAKSASYYTSLKRLYLPIWGVAAANAIDLITGASGTFNGGVTHGAGFVQSNGTTGYFDMGVKSAALGITAGDGSIGWLSNGVGSGTVVNSIGAGTAGLSEAFLVRWIDSTGIQYLQLDVPTLFQEGASTIDSNYGIITCRKKSNTNEISKRDSSSRSVLVSAAGASGGTNPDLNIFAMSWNNNGSPITPSNVKYSSWFIALGLTSGETDNFTLHLKNLWEQTTGLTLP